jgi:stage II sporulation protein AA (anti-sigma F factor antagonist)
MRQRPAFSSLGSVRGIGRLRPAAGASGEGEAMALTLHICPGDSSAVVWASGDFDTNAAETFPDVMLSVMGRPSPSLLLDLSGVSFMDCAGLRALLMTHRLAAMRGGSVCLIAESPAVHRIIDLLDVRDVFPVRERLAELSAALLSLLSRP